MSLKISAANSGETGAGQAVVREMAVRRPTGEQHFCGDRGYDAKAVHEFLKHRRRRGEPPAPEPDIPGEAQYPARRWVLERTFS